MLQMTMKKLKIIHVQQKKKKKKKAPEDPCNLSNDHEALIEVSPDAAPKEELENDHEKKAKG